MSGSLDELLINMRKECTMELAGMLKEIGKGSIKQLNKILARFCLQEARTMRKAKEYLRLMVESGLVTYTQGRKNWIYNEDAEWELFKVNV